MSKTQWNSNCTQGVTTHKYTKPSWEGSHVWSRAIIKQRYTHVCTRTYILTSWILHLWLSTLVTSWVIFATPFLAQGAASPFLGEAVIPALPGLSRCHVLQVAASRLTVPLNNVKLLPPVREYLTTTSTHAETLAVPQKYNRFVHCAKGHAWRSLSTSFY